MDNQPWDKAKLEEWKKFWESGMGEEALKKMNAIKDQMTMEAMKQGDSNAVMAYIGRAAGIEMVIEDIQAGFEALKKLEEEEAAKPKDK